MKKAVGVHRIGSLSAASAGALILVLGSGCASTRVVSTGSEEVVQTEGRAHRAPASASTTVLRKLMVEATEEGSGWLAKLLGKGPEAEVLAGRVRNGLSTLKPSEIREDQKLISILSKDVMDVTQEDAKYLLDIASNRAVSLANCAECVIRRKEFLGYRKIIRERMMGVAGSSTDARRNVVNFLKRAEILFDKGVAEPKNVHDFLMAVNAERFKAGEVGALLDTVQAMLLSVGKDIDPKAASEIINNWPDSSLKGLRKFYSEVVLVQASDGVELEAAADIVLRRLSVSDSEEMKVMKVCSLIRR
ncbi:MAG: hypothetical protein KGQ59_09770 [Bdellovibrionales bacterium]|nr:hypothetical protein [Bdellovibrionales bacterium]